jgi:hypothetical protein
MLVRAIQTALVSTKVYCAHYLKEADRAALTQGGLDAAISDNYGDSYLV